MKNKLTLASILLLSSSIAFAQTSVTFNYTGALQTWVVPPCVTKVTVTVDGGGGGTGGETSNNTQDVGGKGGEVVGVLNVVVGTTLNIYVGGAGAAGTPAGGGGIGGWNGGGFGLQGYFAPPPWLWFAGGGGGASDIRVGGVALANRVVVAGGGGGAGFNYFACCNYDQGGPGGGATGQSGWSGNVQGAGGSGTGGSQVAGGLGGAWGGYCACTNGTLGIGSNDCVGGFSGNAGGGGGGGYYGGGAGCWSGGGGGSSYTGGLASVTSNTQGTQAGNGVITITYTGGGALLTLNIPPPTNPTCSNCNGSATVNTIGGTAPFTYTWTPGGQTNQTATGLCVGTYTINVIDHCGDTQSATVTLTGNPMTITPVVVDDKCNGQSTGSISTNTVGGTPPYTYSWAPVVNNTPNVSNLSAGSYTLTVTDNNGCTMTSSSTITQPPLLTATVTPTGANCNGMADGSAIVAAGGGTGAYAYLWTPGGNTNANATGISAGTYTVTVTDANGCTASAFGVVTQPAGMTVNLTGPSLICIGGTGTLTATVAGGATPYTYAWPGLGSTNSTANITPVVTQTYTVDVTDNKGCTTTADITVQFGGPPINVTISGTGSMCSGLQGSLCANVTGGTGGNTFVWQPGNLTTPCISISPNATTIYTVTVEDNCGRTATVTTTVQVNPLPTVNFNASLYQGCTPLCTQFYNTTTLSQGSATRYTWAFGNGDTVQSQSPIYCYTNNGKYDVTLTVTSDSGCSSTLKKTGLMTAYSRPAAAFGVSPQPATIINPTIQFTDKSSDQYGVQYWSWNFGDETGSTNTSNLENPSHTYGDTGRYCANLVVMNEHGCTDTATSCLVIDPNFNLYIPSAFTPNGDGKNDVFEPKGQYIKSFEMYIFDRWGTQVFHSTDITKGWNGTVGSGSTIAQEDTYVYKISVTDSQGKQHSYTGNVSIIK